MRNLKIIPGLMAAAMPLVSCQQEKATEPINVIYILCDDMGYRDIEVYGQEKIETPSLNRMAEEGMKFTSFYAGTSVSAPSRASLMTGQHTGHLTMSPSQFHGSRLEFQHFKSGIPTAAPLRLAS